MKRWRRRGRKAAELRESRERREPHHAAAPETLVMHPQRARKLKIARACMLLLGAAFIALGIGMTMHIGEMAFVAPFVLAVGGTAVYSAIKTPDPLLVRWLKGFFMAI